ncbi:MAG: transcriptional regulator [Sulfurimonas sp. RIFOXYD12_FULL_33_39]|uniref:helix-turn-helix domain-containing protein n=1 Tax=unclassified Sulfurimonas TaxID=2623549 RepID=UPI0008D3A631|nr:MULTISPECIES: helix-turn-helix transcriptional regulator [unclassified Sulfurimonas]OHE03198.1 MAG: transcriptional regulator [Sulfurimonas sp. RIFCSPLOWO2_12_FULL_34_6]OHE08989.1 MAG: transcriptional regulator [Sulfurimonas sp. RIFOXYD12_FULL_33_39]OHE14299.1 MAG: transcriptional regulator [Sulfurimonas sp. RIFOXYD2_FULL_34_21]DAB28135.1 MAG TPA: transcriptional regulator [Sulfurimonas sp. UBA10385]
MQFEFLQEEIDKAHKIVGQNVKKYRELKGLTQLELSLEMGNKSVSLVSAAELFTNKKHFNVEHLYKIAKILEVHISVFFEEV